MKQYSCTPPILPGEVMSAETEALCQEFMEAHEVPACLQLAAFQNGATRFGVGSPSVYTPSSTLFTNIPYAEIGEFFNEPLLTQIFVAVLKEDLITNFLRNCQFLQEDFLMRQGYLDVLVMPGVIRISYPKPLSLAKSWAKDLEDHTLSISPSQLTAINLGAYAAGPQSSSHQKVEALSRVEKVRALWEPLHDGFKPSKLNGNFELTDPAIGQESIVKEVQNG